MSFRVRLTLMVATAIAITVAAASAVVWVVAKHQLRSGVDQTLAAQAPVAVAGHNDPFSQLYYVILRGDGSVERTTIPFAVPITARARQVAAAGPDGGYYFTDTTLKGTHVRMLVEGAVDHGQPAAVLTIASLVPTDHALARIRFWIFLIGGMGVAAAAALAAFVAAAALKPIQRLTKAAENVAATGDLTQRVDATGNDELGRLGRRFNGMLAALEESVGRQRRLVADASHELRTPLTAARTNVDLLREGKLPEEEQRHALDEASVELDALTTLVSDLVELARGEERKLRVEDVQLDELVEGVVERAKSRAPTATFVTSLTPTKVRVDAVLLERAVSNLLDNAVKYSPEGAPIEVIVRDGDVIVADHGPGVAAEDMPRIFDRFYRAAASRSKPGAGLGLAIVREAAEAHGGHASVESSPKGARFTLTLPASV
ncbi:MAG: integral rane sensor signal transduction histidine kinase [Actinomycetia bacterium]|nr:integral rane sensor signal transduction histidine kinase [Actinomycetes bacterium]